MSADKVARTERLGKELSRIGHLEPDFQVPPGTLDRKAKSKTAEDADMTLVRKQAIETNWDDGEFFFDATSPVTHVALQHFGIGVGHPLYDEMIAKYAPVRLDRDKTSTKAGFAAVYQLGDLTKTAVDALKFRDLVGISMAVRPFPRHRAPPRAQAKPSSATFPATTLLELENRPWRTRSSAPSRS